MAITGPGLGIVRFEYSGDGVVIAGHVKLMVVPVPGLGIPGIAEIRGVWFKYSGGGVAVDSNGVKGISIPSPSLGSYSSVFTLWAAAAAAAAASSWRSPSPASGSPASPRPGAYQGTCGQSCRACRGACQTRGTLV